MKYFKKLKQQFIKKSFQKKLKKSIIEHKVSAKKIHTVAILTTESMFSKIALQKHIEEKLNVSNCKMYKFKEFNSSNTTPINHFTEKDINWFGKVTNLNLQRFLDEPFDLLIAFFDEKNLYLECAVLASKATFKAGFAQVNSILFDLEIVEKAENYTSFLTELNNYLKILKKLEN